MALTLTLQLKQNEVLTISSKPSQLK